MNRNELLTRREDLEAMLTEIARDIPKALDEGHKDRADILIDAYQAARNRLNLINEKLGE